MKEKIRAFKSAFRKAVCIPSPKQLGQRSNALISRAFGYSGQQGYSWEDYEKEIRIRYPFRYFFFRAIPRQIDRVLIPMRRNWREALYFLKCHLLTSHRHHLLDIRQPKGRSYDYRWGYINPDDKMMLALFTILCDFVEKENPHNPLENTSLEELSAQGQLVYYEGYKEMMDLYHWWNTGRKEDHKMADEFFESYRDEKNHMIYNQKSNQWISMTRDLEAKDDEMLGRLLKIRRQLWS